MGKGQNEDPPPSGPGPEWRAGGRVRASDPECSPEGHLPPEPGATPLPTPEHAEGGTVTGCQRHTAHRSTRRHGLTCPLPGARRHQAAPARNVTERGARGHPAAQPPPLRLARHRA